MKTTRQLAIHLLSTLFLIGFLSNCSRSSQSPSSEASGHSETAAKEAVGGKISVYAWSNYFSPEALAAFEKETGYKADYQIYPEPEEMEDRLKSDPSSLDVIVIDSFNLRRLAQLGLLLPLDHNLLPHKSQIASKFLNPLFDEGNRFSVPHMWGTTLIAYRKDKIPEPSLSWNLLWDEKYKGKIMMIDEKFDPLVTSLLRLQKPVTTRSAEDYQAATDELVRQIELVNVRYGDDQSVMESLASGEVWAAMCYSGDAAEVAGREPNVDFFIPREGASEWVDSFVISRDCKNPKLAHALIDFMLRPENAARNAMTTRYATPNEKAVLLLDNELANDQRIFPPPEILQRCHPLPPLDAELEQLVNRSWHTVQRALSDFTAKSAATRQE